MRWICPIASKISLNTLKFKGPMIFPPTSSLNISMIFVALMPYVISAQAIRLFTQWIGKC